MLSQKTLLDKIEIDMTTGIVFIKLLKTVLQDEVILSQQPHRTSIPPDIDVETQMNAVNAHLSQLKNAPVSGDDISRIKSVTSLVHTPEVRDRFVAEVAAREGSLTHRRI